MLLLFSFHASANDIASEKYCFSSPAESSLAKDKFRAVQVPSDQLTIDGRCFIIQMNGHRHELVQRFIRSSFPHVAITFSSENLRHEPCKLKVEKEKSKQGDSFEVGINQGATINQTESNGSGTDIMKIQTLKEFNLRVDQDEIKGSCRFINPNRYEIKFEVRKNPQQIVPTIVPPGTIVELNETPPDQETSTLMTTIQLNRGEKIEVGSTVKNLRDKGHDVSIQPNLKMETASQISSEKVFLSLD